MPVTVAQGFVCIAYASIAMTQTNSINAILAHGGRDAWLGALYAMVFFILISFLLLRRLNDKEPFLLVVEARIGRFFTYSLKVVLFAYMLMNAFIHLKDLSTWTSIVFLPSTPKWIFLFPLLVICFFIAVHGYYTLGAFVLVSLPILFLVTVSQFVLSTKYVHFSLLNPIGTVSLHHQFLAAIAAFRPQADLFLLFLFRHRIAGTFSKTKMIIFTSLVGGTTVMMTIYILATYGVHEALKHSFPVFSQSRLISLSEYIEHLDFLSMYAWICFCCANLSLLLLLMQELRLFGRFFNQKWFLLTISLSIYVAVLIPWGELSYRSFITLKFIPYSTVVALLFMLLALFMKQKRRKVP
jgi:hypothetical protein